MTARQVSPPAGKSRDRTVLSLSILSAVLFLPIGLHLPYFPVYLAARGLTRGEIAAVLATPMILRVAATPIIAAIADQRGIAATLAACALAMLAGYCGLGFADGFAAIFVGGVLAATAMGMMPSLADALTLSEIRRADAAGLRPIGYSRIRVWTPIGVLAIMLLSGPIVAACPGSGHIVCVRGHGFDARPRRAFRRRDDRKRASPALAQRCFGRRTRRIGASPMS